MNPNIIMLYDKVPGTLPLYLELEQRVLAAYPDIVIPCISGKFNDG